MSSLPASARLACVAPAFLERAPSEVVEDWLATLEPDLIALTATAAQQVIDVLKGHVGDQPPCLQPASRRAGLAVYSVSDVQFIQAPSARDLERVTDAVGQDLDPSRPTFVLSGGLELDVDTTALETTLVGRKQYAKAFAVDDAQSEYIHLSTSLPADYRQDWDGLTVVGAGRDPGVGETPLLALDCWNDGRVITRRVRPSRLGLRALERVGSTRGQQLREAGYRDRAVVAKATIEDLAGLPGIGRATADRIHQSARAMARGEVIRTSDEPLPPEDPVFIDIETDGLEPTVTWLIGVLDGEAKTGNYSVFRAPDPDQPGQAIEDFMAWYGRIASPRPLVAYNGWGFDFPVLEDHLQQYCPRYETAWREISRFDPYRWAVEEDNALLPGRTNRLEDVAAALGVNREETGLTGAAIARVYRRWQSEPSPETAPDWDRVATYCEQDVRDLARVYEAIEAASRLFSTGVTSSGRSPPTTQGTLTEWSS